MCKTREQMYEIATKTRQFIDLQKEEKTFTHIFASQKKNCV